MSSDLGLFLMRVLFGGAIAAHGAQKLFGAFGGHGIDGTAKWLESIGFHGRKFAIISGLGEFGGGLLLLLGLFTPLGAAGILASMLVAMFTVHIGHGFFGMNNGIEVPYLYSSAAVGIAIAGAGAFSFDSLLGLGIFTRPIVVLLLLALGVAGAFITLSMRKQPPAAAQQPRGEKREAA